MSEAAKLLELNFSNQDLYYFLQLVGIIESDRKPNKRYVELGFLEEHYGTKNKNSNATYPTTKFTPKGINWLLNEVKPDILILVRLR